jgi:hypothetical protein
MDLVGDRAAPLPAHVQVRGRAVPVWPDGQGWSIVCEASTAITRFADHATYGDDLAGDALTAESDARFGGVTGPGKRAACGHKVYDLPRWRTPAADLVHARALALAQRCLSCVEVIADDTWCSIYRDGDYCLPHSHLRSEVSLICMLDPGETVADDSHSGLLCFNLRADRVVLPGRARSGDPRPRARDFCGHAAPFRQRVPAQRDAVPRPSAANHVVVERRAPPSPRHAAARHVTRYSTSESPPATRNDLVSSAARSASSLRDSSGRDARAPSAAAYTVASANAGGSTPTSSTPGV